MKISSLNQMTRGWFIGDFNPSLFKTTDVEVAVKAYKAGELETSHYHKIATEYTVIVSGTVRMFGTDFTAGDIVIVEPDDITSFECVTDAITVVVKLPGAVNDKYVVTQEVNHD